MKIESRHSIAPLDGHIRAILDDGYLSFQTSGTTGNAKFVMHSARNMISNAKAFNESTGIDSDTVMYHCLPLDYMGGFLNTILCPFVAGGSTYVDEFIPFKFWERVRSTRTNATWLSPTQVKAIMMARRDGDAAPPDGMKIFVGFAPLDRKLREDWYAQYGTPLLASYGTSELMLISVQDGSNPYADDVGQLLPGVTAKTRNIGESGDCELLVSSEHDAAVYVVNGEYVEIPRDDGFMFTGDIGSIRERSVKVTGRIKELIKRGGVSVYPHDIEAVIRKVGGVRDVAVVGIPHEFWGEKVVAVVESAVYPDVMTICRAELPRTHCPDDYVYVETLPRTSTGKVIKVALIEKMKSMNISM